MLVSSVQQSESVIDIHISPLFQILSLYRLYRVICAPVLLPGKSHGRRSLVGCSPWGREESDTTERLHFHFPLSCIGEGNGNLLQCSCLENPMDGEAWWAAVHGVAQSRTRLKRHSNSSTGLLDIEEPDKLDGFFNVKKNLLV